MQGFGFFLHAHAWPCTGGQLSTPKTGLFARGRVCSDFGGSRKEGIALHPGSFWGRAGAGGSAAAETLRCSPRGGHDEDRRLCKGHAAIWQAAVQTHGLKPPSSRIHPLHTNPIAREGRGTEDLPPKYSLSLHPGPGGGAALSPPGRGSSSPSSLLPPHPPPPRRPQREPLRSSAGLRAKPGAPRPAAGLSRPASPRSPRQQEEQREEEEEQREEEESSTPPPSAGHARVRAAFDGRPAACRAQPCGASPPRGAERFGV